MPLGSTSATEHGPRVIVIFDFDGTLVDSFSPRSIAHGYVAEQMREALVPLGLRASSEDVLKAVQEAELSMNRAHVYSRHLWWRAVAAEFAADVTSVPERVWDRLTECYWMTIAQHSVVYPKVHETLGLLKGSRYTIGMLSDTDGYSGIKRRRIALSGLVSYFDAVVIAGEDTARVKPDPEPFLAAQRALGDHGATCIYVGDNPSVDVAGARNAGMRSVLVGDIDKSSPETPAADFLLGRSDLPDLIDIAASLTAHV